MASGCFAASRTFGYRWAWRFDGLQRASPISPEIQLLYKAKDPRPRDQTDFKRIVPQLDPGARAWLRDALGGWIPAMHGHTSFLRFRGGHRAYHCLELDFSSHL
jgi:hypothetical protein